MLSKNKGLPSNLMGDALKGQPAAAVPDAPPPTDGDDELKTFSLRLPVNVADALRVYFRHNHALSLGAGIRMWLVERMREEGIR